MISPEYWKRRPLPAIPTGEHTPDISDNDGYVDVKDLARLLNNWSRD